MNEVLWRVSFNKDKKNLAFLLQLGAMVLSKISQGRNAFTDYLAHRCNKRKQSKEMINSSLKQALKLCHHFSTKMDEEVREMGLGTVE